MGVPIVDMHQLMNRVAAEADTNEEFSHPFFKKVRDMVNAGDVDMLHKEKIPLKLLRLTDAAQDGFVLLNYPGSRAEAELMEEYKGGMNSFIHLSMPDEILVEIEENKVKCAETGKVWCDKEIISPELGIRINRYQEPNEFNNGEYEDLLDGSQPAKFEAELEAYKSQKDELLSFYNHYGLLVDYDMKHGYEDYDKIKR